MHLGGDDDILAPDLEIPDRLAEQFFGLAQGIDVGGVEEVDAGGHGSPYDLVHTVLSEARYLAPQAVLSGWPEGHRSETEFGDEKSCVP
jgi:hypothetical protein